MGVLVSVVAVAWGCSTSAEGGSARAKCEKTPRTQTLPVDLQRLRNVCSALQAQATV